MLKHQTTNLNFAKNNDKGDIPEYCIRGQIHFRMLYSCRFLSSFVPQQGQALILKKSTIRITKKRIKIFAIWSKQALK